MAKGRCTAACLWVYAVCGRMLLLYACSQPLQNHDENTQQAAERQHNFGTVSLCGSSSDCRHFEGPSIPF